MTVTVAEVHSTAGDTPHGESYPGFPGKIVHEISAGKNSHGCYQPYHRAAEGSVNLGLGDSEHHYADGSHKECTEGTDICHFSNEADGSKSGNY